MTALRLFPHIPPRPAIGHFDVLRECRDFSDIIAVSRQMSVKSSAEEADEEALRLQHEEGLVFDLEAVADNDAFVAQHGIEAALSQASSRIRHITLRSNPDDSPIIQQASEGAPLLVHPDQSFTPNMGQHLHPFPFAPQLALAAHCAREMASGIVYAISLTTFLAALATTGLPGHVAELFTQPKTQLPTCLYDTPLRRDQQPSPQGAFIYSHYTYTHPIGGGRVSNHTQCSFHFWGRHPSLPFPR
jgi:hypothetical protein